MDAELLERQRHLDSLAWWWDEAVAGEGRLVFVAGEAGARPVLPTRLEAVVVQTCSCSFLLLDGHGAAVLDMEESDRHCRFASGVRQGSGLHGTKEGLLDPAR